MTIKLTVFLNQQTKQKIGTLALKDKKIYFEYDKEFLKSCIELSPYKLPLKVGLFRCDDDTFEGVWGVFADSLPDGWGRLLMDRHLQNVGINPHSISPLDRLALVGNHAMGALSYEPDVAPENSLEEIVLDDLAQSSQDILEGSSEILLDELLTLGGSSAGARPKVLVQLSEDLQDICHGREALKEGYSYWLVKFASSLDAKEVGAIEYAYYLMAKDAGLEIQPCVLLKGKKGSYFATKRFDRVGEKRVHMHSVAGLIHSDFRYPALDYDDLLRLTLHLTKNMQDVKKVFRLACFNLFSHNRDDHAKNFSFLMNEEGKWRFSPAYDLTYSYGVGTEHSTMFMGEGKNPTKKHLELLAKNHLIKEYSKIIDTVYESVKKWQLFSAKAGVSASFSCKIEKDFIL